MDYHKKMSFIKSGIRIFGFLLLMLGLIHVAGLVLLGAEIFGILEERDE